MHMLHINAVLQRANVIIGVTERINYSIKLSTFLYNYNKSPVDQGGKEYTAFSKHLNVEVISYKLYT